LSFNRSVIIRVTNEAIWFNDTMSVFLIDTNLPVGEFRFVEGRSVFWEVDMISYHKDTSNLTIRIINYRPADVDEFLNQRPKAEVKFLSFTEIYWPAFNADLSFFKKTAFTSLLTEKMPLAGTESTFNTVHIKADIAFNKVRFGTGFVAFDYKFLWSGEKTEVKILNGHILPEFEFIKTYFSKHFNSRTFQVLLVVRKSGRTTEKIVATSVQIDQIKDVAIETMKFIRMERLKKLPTYIKEINKSLFTANDIFDPFDKNFLGTYQMTQKELFDQVMKWDDIRNKKQLEYLAGYLHESSEKIRFTLTPKFGFLFVAHGERMIHYIWEMLNTNATYIWGFDKGIMDDKKQLIKMEEAISFIRNNGRDSYVRNVSPYDNILFRRIMHKGARSQLVDHFPRWRHEVNEAIV